MNRCTYNAHRGKALALRLRRDRAHARPITVYFTVAAVNIEEIEHALSGRVKYPPVAAAICSCSLPVQEVAVPRLVPR